MICSTSNQSISSILLFSSELKASHWFLLIPKRYSVLGMVFQTIKKYCQFSLTVRMWFPKESEWYWYTLSTGFDAVIFVSKIGSSLSQHHIKLDMTFFLSSTLQLFTLSLHLIFLLRARQRLFCPLSELVLIFYMTIGIGLDQKNSVCVCCVNSLVVSAHWWSVFQSAYFSVRTTIINWQFSLL